MEDIKKYIIDLFINERYESSRFVAFVDEKVCDGFNKSDIIEFISFALDFLEIGRQEKQLSVKLTNQPEPELKSFAYYVPNEHYVYVNCKNRHKLDVFRSLAHELVHYSQDLNGELNDPTQVQSENDGVPIENEANSVAGVIMREYGRKRPEFFG